MSINVTVTGNPIKIHRGKLITTDLQQDVDKRRKMRLQQVRQQSKDFAAAVRNNVKKVKNKQQTNFEKQNNAKLKEWQNKKLLQLQNVYEDNVKDIGIGHAGAQISEIEEIQQIERQKIINEEMASRRGRSAQEMLQVKKNEQSLQKAIPRQAKQFAREVENARAAMIVSQSAHKTPKKKKVTKGSFNIDESTSKVVPDKNDVESAVPECKEQSSNTEEKVIEPIETTSYQRSESVVTRSPTKRFRHEDTSRVSIVSLDVPTDTRITDRIRSRHLVTAPMSDIPEASNSSASNFEFHESNHENKENITNRVKNYSSSTQQGVSIPPETREEVVTCPICVKHANPFAHACACSQVNTGRPVCVPSLKVCSNTEGNQAQNFEIPSKPSVRLAPESYAPQYSQRDVSSGNSKEYRRVRSYDRNNRFGHHYITDTTHVHRIQDDELAYSDLEAGPSRRHTSEFSKMADERAKMADMRGRKALEKENIHKDYEKLMKRLPLLQKQGRIANLNPSKDKLHMSESRKKEHEKLRQEKMERAFEKLAPTTTITIPSISSRAAPSSRAKSPNKTPKTPQKSIKPIGTWKKTTVETSTNASPETSNLLNLLKKLRSQKEELLKECKDLPQDSNFYNFIDDLDFVARTHSKNDKNIQTEPRKQAGSDVMRKVPKQVLILQNTSTQTSPKVSNTASCNTESDAEPPPKQPKTAQDPNICNNVCSCKSHDKLCEILIKIRDCAAHSVEKKPSNKENTHEDRRKVEETLNLETGKSRKTNHSKSDDSEGSISPKRSRSESPKKTPRKVENIKQNIPKTTVKNNSWKQHFSVSSVRNPDEITSSTSYYSPPDYNLQAPGEKQKETLSNFPPPIDNTLLSYINKMLEVSKGKLNLLAANVSSISEVATPSSSIINIQSNRPPRTQTANKQTNHNDSTHIEKLTTLLKYFNLTPGDFRSFVSIQSTSSHSRTRSNSVGSSTTQGTQSSQSRQSRSNTPVNTGLSLEHYTQTPSMNNAPVVDHFAQWADLCQARINNLTAMIDKVRMEKKEILSPCDEKIEAINKSNNLTSYLNLPQNQDSDLSSPEQKQLDRQLLDVQDGAKSHAPVTKDPNDFANLLQLSEKHPDLDRDIVERYMKLVDVELQAQRSKSPERMEKPKSPEKSVSFKPMLDIPKLPKFQPQPSLMTASTSTRSNGKKPPVTNNALRFNDVIHELSAIPEAENSRLSKSPSSRKSASPQKRLQTQRSPTKSQASTSRKQIITKKTSDTNLDSPASEKSNESVESMLKTLGLDWAINTLKIMNAANNNSSSSTSSIDIDQKKFSYLVSKNVSTSTEKTNASIHDASRLQRTSTPVQTTNSSKSQPSHKLFNSGESEISPVGSGQRGGRKDNSDKSPGFDSSQHTFHTLPSHSVHHDSDS
ncbi:LOW QUALITY PROTEIN: uncharacterized protein [Atheta coriaria]|uniref:LOW QUALITY PROTEIN: uncharacterized protein n=1 Tax=Dalotia coriaria TaxID=877792 RepID=UPI0031F4295B